MNSQKIKYFRNFKYCFFTRNGGVSIKNFRSLNCAFKDEENPKNVKENREIIKKKFCKKKKIILLNQVHSNKVVFLNKKIPKVITGDGVITNRKDLCLGILTVTVRHNCYWKKFRYYSCWLERGFFQISLKTQSKLLFL